MLGRGRASSPGDVNSQLHLLPVPPESPSGVDENSQLHLLPGFGARLARGHDYKAILGREMRARTLAGQQVEARIGAKMLNTMASLGIPDSYRVA